MRAKGSGSLTLHFFPFRAGFAQTGPALCRAGPGTARIRRLGVFFASAAAVGLSRFELISAR